MTMITESRAATRPLAPTGLFASVVLYFTSYRRNRRILTEISAMDDHILRDIGLSRADVNKASVAEMGTDRLAMLGRARSSRIG